MEKRYTMPVVLRICNTPIGTGCPTLKENNISVAKQEIENEMWLVANSGSRSAEESSGIGFGAEFGVAETM